jgi:hypothetical protein
MKCGCVFDCESKFSLDSVIMQQLEQGLGAKLGHCEENSGEFEGWAIVLHT